MSQALPTARDEAWRYSDHAALTRARALPVAANDAAAEVLLASGARLALQLTAAPGEARLSERAYRLAPGTQAMLAEAAHGGGWIDGRCQITVEAGATLDHVIRQSRDGAAVTTLRYDVRIAAGGRYRAFVLNDGGAMSRIDLTITLAGSGAETQLDGVQLADGSGTVELIAQVIHASPGAQSRQAVKSVVGGMATATYLGKIKVEPDAQGTDAEQSSKALLLSRTAQANTKPELEIYADDVTCAHGATVGELDPAALFYLQARGLDLPQARAMLIEAFMADLIERIDDPMAREVIAEEVGTRLASLVQGAGR